MINQRLKSVLKYLAIVISILIIAQFARLSGESEWDFGKYWSNHVPSEILKVVERSPEKRNVSHYSPSFVKRPRPEIDLKVFDADAFRAANVGQDHVDLKDCILSKHISVTMPPSTCPLINIPKMILYFQPHYFICTFSAKIDAYVSGSIRSGKGWEGQMSTLLVKMLKNYGEKAILLDFGTNIGSHALFGAINKFFVFGVEPQTVNLAKV